MKLKILFFPLAIIIALWVSIGYIKPGIAEIMALRGAAADLTAKQEVLQQRVDNVARLSSQLSQNATLEASALHYLPQTKEADVITDSINFIASQTGVQVVSMGFTEEALVADLVVAEQQAPASAEVLPQDFGSDVAVVPAEPAVVPVAPQYVTVKFEGNGSYQNIKDFLYRLSHVNRFHNFQGITIDHAQVQAAGTDTSKTALSDVLKVDTTLKFEFFPKLNDIRNASADPNKDALLVGAELNTDPVQSMEEFVNTASAKVPAIDGSGGGKANPFVK